MEYSRDSLSFVNYYGKHADYSCGYCKGNRNVSHGMSAYELTVQAYQDIIDRGWRRSGTYCYKPAMDETCCPSYTIKCDVRKFKLSKSHKKILKRMNKFLLDGNKKDERHTDGNCESTEFESHVDMPLDVEKCRSNSTKRDDFDSLDSVNIDSELKGMKRVSNRNETIADAPCSAVKRTVESSGADASSSTNVESAVATAMMKDCNNPLRKKAKLMRIERKREKMAKQGLVMGEKKTKNYEKSLEDFLGEQPTNGVHRLQVKLVPAKAGETQETFELYKTYQMVIHNDAPEKLQMRRYLRFLVESPLKTRLVRANGPEFYNHIDMEFELFKKYQTIVHNDPPETEETFTTFLGETPLKDSDTAEKKLPLGYGSFHQQYLLDDKLIAVGVIDILPKCISSVYFFYDPEYAFLSLGTYGSLYEIAFTKEMGQLNPEICSYYMGFYIHSCPKMRYKGKLYPSYLLCPEVYTWHLIDDGLLKRLDESKYQRLNADLTVDDHNKPTSIAELQNTFIMYRRAFMKLHQYLQMVGESKCAEVMEYATLIGMEAARLMVKLE